MMAKLDDVKIKVKMDFEIRLSLWDAIKLRIAGKGCKGIVDEIVEKIKLKKGVRR